MDLTIIAINKVDEFYKVWLARDVVETNYVDGEPVAETVRNEFAVVLPKDKVEGVTSASLLASVKAAASAVFSSSSTAIPAVATGQLGKTIKI